MRFNSFIFLMVGWFILTSCDLGGVSGSCNGRQFFTAAEFYLIEESGQQYLSGDLDLTNRFTLCEPVSAPDTVGFDNLFSVDGVIVEDCDAGICVTVSRFNNPYCELEYDIGGSNLPLFGIWRIAYLEEETMRLFPSCNEIQLFLNITPNADSSQYLTEGIFGANSFFNTFEPVDGQGLLTDQTRRTFLQNSSYAQIMEDKLNAFFATGDTIRYEIMSNEMSFELPGKKIQFFQEL